MALNNKLIVGGNFCDLQKAFVCVDHEILLAKMYQYGIIGMSHNLITSYLENGSQRVIITTSLNHTTQNGKQPNKVFRKVPS